MATSEKGILEVINTATLDGLEALVQAIEERKTVLRHEQAIEMGKTIRLGNYVLYSKNGRTKLCGIVDSITENFIGVKKVGESGKQKRRQLTYSEIEAISEKLEEGWAVETA